MNTRIHFFTILLFRLATPLVSMPTQAQMQANEQNESHISLGLN